MKAQRQDRELALAARLLGALVANRVVEHDLDSAAGRVLYSKVLYRLVLDERQTRAVKRRVWRDLVLRALTEQLWRRWRFRWRHGFWPPAAVMVSVTRRCNLACAGCFADGWDAGGELSYKTVAGILAELRGWGGRTIILGGGEPLCWPHFFRLIESHRWCTFIVYTNGTLIDRRVAERLARAPHVVMAVSIDGDEALHDARRGPGSYARAMAGLQHLSEARALSAFSVTLTRRNHEVALSDAFVDQFEQLGCLLGFYLGYMPVDEQAEIDGMPSVEQRLQRLARIAELQRTRRIVFVDFTNAGPVANGCGAAGRMYLHVNPQGDIEPCPFCHFATHNVHRSSLTEALKEGLCVAFRRWQAAGPDARRPCPMVDQPAGLREMVAASGARPTHPGAARLLNELAPVLDAYSAELGQKLAAQPSTTSAR